MLAWLNFRSPELIVLRYIFLLKADIYNDKWIGNQFYRKAYIKLKLALLQLSTPNYCMYYTAGV